VLSVSNCNSYAFFTQLDMCINAHILHNIKKQDGRKKYKNWDISECRLQGYFSSCHFGHACHRFVKQWQHWKSKPRPFGLKPGIITPFYSEPFPKHTYYQSRVFEIIKYLLVLKQLVHLIITEICTLQG
jgi:hypothetical protein